MSDSAGDKYPRRILAPGSSKYVTKSIHHYFQVRKITNLKLRLGVDVYNEVRDHSQVGDIVKFAEEKRQLGGKHLMYLFANRLDTYMPHELWVLADGRPLRFSLHEYAHVTGLKCFAEANDGEERAVEDGALARELQLEHKKGPSWPDIDAMINVSSQSTREKKMMLMLLAVLHAGVLVLHPASRIPMKLAKLVTDRESFERHPWGREGFDSLFGSIRKPADQYNSLHLFGLVPALEAWAYEVIPALGNVAGIKRPGTVPLLKWGSADTRSTDIEVVLERAKSDSPDHKVFSSHLELFSGSFADVNLCSTDG